MSGRLITVEGIEGSGKTTIAKRLVLFFKEKNIPCLYTREPGGTTAGEALRSIILDAEIPLCQESELLLIEAARAQIMREIVFPSLNAGQHVILDRHTDSTMAYQGYGRGMNRETVEQLNSFATQSRTPDLTILLDIDAPTGVARAQKITSQQGLNDRFETENIQFMEKVREGFLEIAQNDPERIILIDSRNDIEKVWEAVEKKITDRWPALVS